MDKPTTWALFFSNVYAWQFHPGNPKPNKLASIEECATYADAMIEHYERRFPWDTYKQEPQSSATSSECKEPTQPTPLRAHSQLSNNSKPSNTTPK